MDIHEIKQIAIELMDAVKTRGIAEFSLDTQDFKIKVQGSSQSPAPYAAQSPAAQPADPVPAAQVQPEEVSGTRVTAPLVGVFYATPTPEEPPYIEVGQAVKKGDTLFIIEAMKTMNEIAAPCDGTVSRILAQTGDVVEFGQTLVVIA